MNEELIVDGEVKWKNGFGQSVFLLYLCRLFGMIIEHLGARKEIGAENAGVKKIGGKKAGMKK